MMIGKSDKARKRAFLVGVLAMEGGECEMMKWKNWGSERRK